MYLPDFEYYLPATVEEACLTLARSDGNARVLAGGTDLLPNMKNEAMAPKALVSLKEIKGLDGITYVPGRGAVIGARATQNDLANSPLLLERYPSLSEAAHSMANNQVRNRGTAGGNLVSAVPSADLPPILIALDARIILAGPQRTRTIPLEQFFVGPRRLILTLHTVPC